MFHKYFHMILKYKNRHEKKQNETHYGVVYIPDYRTTTSQCFLAFLTLLKTKILEAASKNAACPFSILQCFHSVAFCNVPASGEYKPVTHV